MNLGSNKTRNVVLLSYLAMGTLSSLEAPAYLERALAMDPNNLVVADRIIELYGYRGRYSDARRVLADVLPEMTSGPLKDELLKESKRIATIRDTVPVAISP